MLQKEADMRTAEDAFSFYATWKDIGKRVELGLVHEIELLKADGSAYGAQADS